MNFDPAHSDGWASTRGGEGCSEPTQRPGPWVNLKQAPKKISSWALRSKARRLAPHSHRTEATPLRCRFWCGSFVCNCLGCCADHRCPHLHRRLCCGLFRRRRQRRHHGGGCCAAGGGALLVPRLCPYREVRILFLVAPAAYQRHQHFRPNVFHLITSAPAVSCQQGRAAAAAVTHCEFRRHAHGRRSHTSTRTFLGN